MKREMTSLLLIFLMLAAPIVSAFEHCTGMSVIDSDQSVMQHQSDQGQPSPLRSDSDDNHCQAHSGSDCVFHSCGHAALSAGAVDIVQVLTTTHLVSEHFSRYVAPQFPLIRPPITIL